MRTKRRGLLGAPLVRKDGATGLMSNDTKKGLLDIRLLRKKRRYH